MFAKIIVDHKIPYSYQYFDYIIPENKKNKAQRGMRVIVPFGRNNNFRLGYILQIKNTSDHATKNIEEFLDETPFLNEEMFLLTEEILKTPFIDISTAYNIIIPRSFSTTYSQKIDILKESELPSEIKNYLMQKKGILNFKNKFISRQELIKLQNKKIIKINIIIDKKHHCPKPQILYYLNPCLEEIQNIKLTPLNKKKINNFSQQMKKNKSLYLNKKEILNFFSPKMLNKLLMQKIILTKFQKLNSNKEINYTPNNDILLNKKQIFFWEQLNFENYHNYLLYYDHYDDKIKIYLKLIEHSLKNKKQVLIIVAEIILINLLKKEIQKYFPYTLIAIFDNDFNLETNYQKNIDIQQQKIFIIIGARKIIFAPLTKIGVIIIDEENDESLIEKEKHPHYSVKELAMIRAKYHQIPLICFTTTPSVENYYNIKKKKISFFDLTNIQKKKNIQIVDMKEELKKGNLEPLSSILLKKLKYNIKEKQKTILFINIKGFAPFVLCRFCSYIPKCKKCNQNLILFNNPENILKCNLCNYKEIFNPCCNNCSNNSLKNVMLGIEYIESFLKKKFPSIELARIDSDSIKNNQTYQEILNNLEKNKIDILLGTEMIVKNLKLPFIKTIGILMTDVLLNMRNFKATEKTFQILKKISNYTSEKGEMIIQSYNTKHYILQKFNYDNIFSFLEQILEERKITNNPPFNFVSKILIVHKKISKVLNVSQKIKKILENHLEYKIKVLGPNHSLLFYKNQNYRMLLTLKYTNWPLNLNFIIENNLHENCYILFDRFNNII
ncbi:replication restart helicase PriA [Candidatus Phytoplasma luffae]|nr:primosomal protein N' [Candidatus Phytoplasma luffae]